MNTAAACWHPLSLNRQPAWGAPVGRARIRSVPEDFQVVEIPLVDPCGEGEHNWLYVRKRNSNTQWVAKQLAQFAGLPVSAVSYAGLKDRHALTEQWFSVHLAGRDNPDWTLLHNPEFQVLSSLRHRRKLKTGALRGNRFNLRLRELTVDTAALETRLEQIRQGGLPNYFGEQRFGIQGENLNAAARYFQQPRRISRARRGIYLSAVRAALFNRVLDARVTAGSWNRALAGDALQLDGKSACFVAETLDEEIRQRVGALQLHPTGPLCGNGEVLCRGAARAFEADQLRDCSEWIDGLKAARVDAARRALRVVPRKLAWRQEDQTSGCLSFELPAGSYATGLLSELVTVSQDT